jgi:ferredoxin
MAYVITDACTKDFICAAECATAAIAPASKGDAAAAGVSQLFINPDECIDCGNCASVCPSSAIFSLDDLPGDKADFAGKNKAYFN